jgi:hypothetical protein
MIDKLRLSVVTIIAVMVTSGLIAFLFTPNNKQTKYTIQIPHGRDYQTNNYILNGSCITFKNECGCKNNKTITVCGNYTIITR